MDFKKVSEKFLNRLAINRKYKDRLFQRVFRDKKDLLDLYNAINDTDYDNPDELEITTLEDVVYLSMKNDLSFVVSATMNLYEHQSTFNPNIPIRGFMYFSRLYETYIQNSNLDMYGSVKIKLPSPRFVVFYNGKKGQPDEMMLKLSEMFEESDKESDGGPALECCARMLNINYGHNLKILKKCKRLHDYSYFIAEVNKNIDNGYSLRKAINDSIDICIEKDILRDILEKSRNEVREMLLTEYDEKKQRKMLYRDAKAEGEQIGTLVAKSQAVIEVLEIYGDVPVELHKLIEKEDDLEKLSELLKLAVKSGSVQEFMKNL